MFSSISLLLTLISVPIFAQISGQPLSKGSLKTELLANLNKHSDTEAEKLEMWVTDAPTVPPSPAPVNMFGAGNIFQPPFSLTNEPPGGKLNPIKPLKPNKPPILSTAFQFTPTVSNPHLNMNLSSAHAEDIRNWRQRFYKIFRNRAKIMRKESKKVAKEPPKVVVHFNDTNEPMIDKNFQVLMARKDPNWLTDDKVKAFARDKKGHIIRLFGVESSGYRYNFTQPQLPDISFQNIAQPASDGPVYIPASSIPSQPPLQPAKYEEASVHTIPPPAANTYRSYQTPEPIRLLSVFAPSTPVPVVVPMPAGPMTDSMLTSEVDQSPDYSGVGEQTQQDCPLGQCHNTAGASPENDDKCNSPRLQALIQNNIVQGDAEASKRAIQTQAELELNQFFNVICGTGFFSYIAHTDEFCQVSSGGINCYAFSPVCSLRPGPQAPVPQVASPMGLGLGGVNMAMPFGKTRKKAVVNRN